MDMLLNPFKRALKAGKLQIGLWQSLASHITVEILSDAGFDWLLLDTEHAPNELPMVHSQLQAAATGTAHPVVRPAWNDQVIIKRLLDIGTQSLLIPYIETEEEARRAVASTRYPPEGVRGFASSPVLRASPGSRTTMRVPARRSAFCCKWKRGSGLRTWRGSPGSRAWTGSSSGQAISRPRSAIWGNLGTRKWSKSSMTRLGGSEPAGRRQES